MQETINWNAELYDEKHHFVSDYGEDLLKILDPLAGEQILDAGCGTGTLADQISKSGAEVTGIDQSADMILRAKTTFPKLAFQVADLTDFDLKKTFNAIFSNATLHWVRPPEKAAACLYRHLKPGGRMILEMGGEYNVAQIVAAIRKSLQMLSIEQNATVGEFWYFPSPGTYVSLLEKAGFEVQFVHYFERPTSLTGLDGMKNWIEMFGGYFFRDMDGATAEKVIKKAVELLEPTHFKAGIWWADYRRLRIKAIKPL